ncbi:hypothetical protein AB0O22_38880 [Streptomyces sp. NPDC091204]|uniref:hypothetical protein n=1 Tax=Streptomyces sp. NPDC091204 TaxID=3155299 RepID=UPI003428C18E
MVLDDADGGPVGEGGGVRRAVVDRAAERVDEQSAGAGASGEVVQLVQGCRHVGGGCRVEGLADDV